jgi:tellurite resistance protein
MNLTKSYLDLMFCVLIADGHFDEKEKTLFNELLDSAEIDDAIKNEYLNLFKDEKTKDIDELLESMFNSITANFSQLAVFTRDAYLMASIDGNIGDSEAKVINSFLKSMGIPDDRFEQIKEWAIESIELFHKGEKLFERE